MPVFHPNIQFSDCWSSIGEITFYHRYGKCYWRKKASPEFPGTQKQMAHQAVHQRALAAWRSLDHQIQERWRFYARGVPARRPPFLNENHISGYNLFVSAYHGFATLGNEHTPTPAKFETFPGFNVSFLDSELIGNSKLLLKFLLSVEGSNNPMRYRLLGKIQLVEPGKGCHPGKLRNYLSDEISSVPPHERVIGLLIPDYQLVWNLDLHEYTFHMRYLLLDTKNGYRNIPKQISNTFLL